MEYSIQALSRLSGVTTRTLRWYDEIGLLKPSRVAESGYRYYGPAEVDRLQDILYYRALGVELARIKRCLDDPSFDRLAALRSHLTALEAERARLEGLIRSVRQTIGAEERKEIMDDKQKFEAFKQRVVDWHQETYGAEARGRYGDAEVEEAQTAVLNLTPEQYQEWTRLGGELQTALERAVASGASPEGEDGRAAAALHRRWLTLTGNQYDPAKHRGLAELYVSDPRFTAYYDRAVPGCSRFLRDAGARRPDPPVPRGVLPSPHRHRCPYPPARARPAAPAQAGSVPGRREVERGPCRPTLAVRERLENQACPPSGCLLSAL